MPDCPFSVPAGFSFPRSDSWNVPSLAAVSVTLAHDIVAVKDRPCLVPSVIATRSERPDRTRFLTAVRRRSLGIRPRATGRSARRFLRLAEAPNRSAVPVEHPRADDPLRARVDRRDRRAAFHLGQESVGMARTQFRRLTRLRQRVPAGLTGPGTGPDERRVRPPSRTARGGTERPSGEPSTQRCATRSHTVPQQDAA